MRSDVTATDSPAEVLERARSFLHRDPVRHNLILTVLEARVAHPDPGRYWIVRLDGDISGIALQSPTDFFATVTPMTREAVMAVVDAIVDQGVRLPGVNGEAATTAHFAGHWTERTRSAAHPIEGQRIYEVEDVIAPAQVPGALRAATSSDRDLVVTWFEEFETETGASGGHSRATIADRRLRAGHLWIWEDGAPAAIAGLSEPVAGVVRVGPVYTPRDRRSRGYASGLVAAVSRTVRANQQRCILYTDLGNPTSNAIYRAIGYRAIDEALRYTFEPQSGRSSSGA
jgi:predicted GNAT family acetyltransferase